VTLSKGNRSRNFDRGLDPFTAFLYGNVGKADDVEVAWLSGTDVHLNFYEVGVNAKDGGAVIFEVHFSRCVNRRDTFIRGQE